jgi:hypothetical protein
MGLELLGPRYIFSKVCSAERSKGRWSSKWTPRCMHCYQQNGDLKNNSPASTLQAAGVDSWEKVVSYVASSAMRWSTREWKYRGQMGLLFFIWTPHVWMGRGRVEMLSCQHKYGPQVWGAWVIRAVCGFNGVLHQKLWKVWVSSCRRLLIVILALLSSAVSYSQVYYLHSKHWKIMSICHPLLILWQ